MTIKEIHDFIYLMTNREQVGYVSHEEIDTVLDRSQMTLFNTFVDEYGRTKRLNTAISPFRKDYAFSNATSPNGIVTMPADYIIALSGHTIVFDNVRGTKRKKLQLVNEDEFVDAIESQLRPISLNRPIAILNGKGKFQLYPEQPQAGVMQYLKRPAVPKFVHTQSQRTITYDPLNSIQLEWGEAEINKIVFDACSTLSITLDDDKMTQYSQMKEQQS